MGQLRTAGLTLKVDGASGFQQALNSASQAITRNNAEMKLLEATYGKSSTSMEYLSQRAELLAQKLEEQQKKTATLQAARDQYAASGEADQAKLEKLDLQIIKSQTAEADLARQIKACNEEMDKQAQEAAEAAQKQEQLEQAGQGAADAQKQLGGAAAEAAGQLDTAGKSADAYVRRIESVGAAAESAGRKWTRFATMPIMGMGMAAVKYGLDFEDSLYEVATLPGVLSGSVEEQAQQMEQYADRLLAASDRSFTAAAELAAAQYDAISASVAPEDSVYWAERAAMAAVAGRSTAASVVNGASSVYNAWGADATRGLDHILDVMIMTQNLGKTTVDELAGSIGKITGLAPQVGMAMEEAFAGVGAMTRNGVDTSSAITGLQGVLTAVIKPTEKAKKEAKALGLDFSVTAMQAKGLTGFLADVAEKTKGDSEALGQLFGNVQGLNSVMQLAGASAADYAEILGELKSASGVLDEAFATRTASRSMQLSGSLNKLKNQGIELAENLYPAVDAVTGLIGGVSNVMSEMDEGSQKTLVNVLGFTAAAGPALTISGKLLKNFGTIKAAMSSPWGWAAMGAVGVGALVYQLATAETAAQKLERTAREMRIEVDPEAVSRMQSTVQRVISLVEKEHYVDAQLNWNTNGDDLQQKLTDTFNGAIEDAHLSLREYSDLLKLLQGDIGGEITEKKKDPLTAALAEELQGAVDEFNGLLELVYRKGGTATEEEIANLETAMERVKALRAELLGAYTETEAAELDTYRKSAQHVKEGYGDETMLATAMGLAAADYKIARAGVDQGRLKASAQLQARLDAAQNAWEKQLAQNAYEKEMERLDAQDQAASAAYAQEMNEIWAGWLSGSEQGRQLDEQLNRYGMMLDILSAMDVDFKRRQNNLDLSVEDGNAALLQSLTPEMVRALGLDDYHLLNAAGQVDLSEVYHLDFMREDLFREATALRENIAEAMQDGENPVAQALSAWAATGYDESAIDPSGISGSFAGFMRLTLFQEGGLDTLGSEAMEAIGAGLAKAAPAAVKEAESVTSSVGKALKGIDSPYQAGFQAVDDLRKGMLDAEADVLALARSIVHDVSSELTLITPGEGLFGGSGSSLGGGVSGSGGTSVDSSVNVTIKQANLASMSNVNVLANQIGALSNSKLRGVGIIP